MPKFTTGQITDAANDFLFTAPNGEKFYAPYLINKNHTQDPSVPRGLGKAYPAEIKASIDYITEMFPGISADEIRAKLVDGSLPEKSMNYKGIDCSGFVYVVFERLYRELYGKEFASVLSVPKDHVLNGAYNLEDWKNAYTLGSDEAEALPEDVPLTWVCEKFHRKPINLCNVRGLASDFTSVEAQTHDILPGDLVCFGSDAENIPHTAIVTDIEGSIVTIAHSSRKDPSDVGGISYKTISIENGTINTKSMKKQRVYSSIRRLKESATNV